MSEVAWLALPGVALGCAAAAGHRPASTGPISARHRRTKQAAPRLIRPAARPMGWGEVPATKYPAATARWFAPGRARVPSLTSWKTANCAAWAVRPRQPAPAQAAPRRGHDRVWRSPRAMAAVTVPPARRGLPDPRPAGRDR